MAIPPPNVKVQAQAIATLEEAMNAASNRSARIQPDGHLHPDEVQILNARFAPHGYRVDEDVDLRTPGPALRLIPIDPVDCPHCHREVPVLPGQFEGQIVGCPVCHGRFALRWSNGSPDPDAVGCWVGKAY